MDDRQSLKFYQADVFTSQPFGGNPVAVFPDAHGLTDDQAATDCPGDESLGDGVRLSTDRPCRSCAVADLYPDSGNSLCRPSGAGHVLRVGPAREDRRNRGGHACHAGMQYRFVSRRIACTNRVAWRGSSCLNPSRNFSIPSTPLTMCIWSAELSVCRSTSIADTKWPLQVVSTGLPVLIVPVRTLTAVRSINPDASAIINVCESIRGQWHYGLHDGDG